MVTATPNYRSDIDGLRGIAVVLVLLFHFNIGPFSGGFIGVDVFFVISGFLITGIIVNGIQAHKFRFTDFYIRRARRLFPALFATVVVCFGAAYLLFSPQSMERFGGSIVHTLLGGSNVYFWRESNYFDAVALEKPLLHTWSLSVEVQFYLVWPALLLLLHKMKGAKYAAPVVIGIIGVASLVLAERWLYVDEPGTFFLLPFRVVEFSFGAVLVWLARFQPKDKRLLELPLLAGLALIGYSAIAYGKDTLFPGLNATIPCLGASLAIYGGTARFSGRILRNPLSVGLGLISYSLYLIHWPLLVFYRYYKFDKLSVPESITLMAIAIASSVLSYRYIETPIRRGARKENHLRAPAFAAVCIFLVGCIVAPAANAWATDGWSWRIPEEVRAVTKNIRKRKKELAKFTTGVNSPSRKPFTDNLTHVLIVGDSHGQDFFNAVHLNRERFKVKGVEFRFLPLDDECFYLFDPKAPHRKPKPSKLQQCINSQNYLKASPLLTSADYILISTRWQGASLRHLKAFRNFAKSKGASLVVLGRTVEFKNVPTAVAGFGRLAGLDRSLASIRNKDVDRVNQRVQRVSTRLRIPYKDKTPIVCAPDLKSCDALDENNNLNFIDYGHWSLSGAKHFGKRMAQTGFLDDLAFPPSR